MAYGLKATATICRIPKRIKSAYCVDNFFLKLAGMSPVFALFIISLPISGSLYHPLGVASPFLFLICWSFLTTRVDSAASPQEDIKNVWVTAFNGP